MTPGSTLVLVLLIPGICEGLDFTFQQSSSNSLDVKTPGGECGVITCTETVSNHIGDSRKIKSLTVYRLQSVDVSGLPQWERLGSVTPLSPTDKRVSDAKHIAGELSDKSARIEVKLQKSNDCGSPKLACISRLEDDNGRSSTVKSVIEGRKGGFVDISELEPAEHGQHAITNNVESFMAALEGKLKCIDDRLRETSNRDVRLEEKMEALNEKINSLEKTASRDLDVSVNRLEDKLDRMKDRLEDKLSELRGGKFVSAVESTSMTEICANFTSQLTSVGNSVNSLGKNMNSLSDQVREVQGVVPTTGVLNTKIDKIVSAVSSIATETSNLTIEVDAISHSCVEKLPSPLEEFFDVFGSGKSEWRLAFRGTAYNNVKIYPAYLYGTGIPADVEVGCKQFNRSLPCANHYRNIDAIDSWANIDEVLFALYVKGQLVKHITFNGRGASWSDWFEVNRVIESSWTDLQTKSHNFFSITGAPTSDLVRRFYVNHVHNGCPKDQGWFVAADVVPGRCPWEKKLAHPVFMYAKGNTVATWDARDTVGTADAMGVFIKYQ